MLQGTIELIDATRTVIRDDDGNPGRCHAQRSGQRLCSYRLNGPCPGTRYHPLLALLSRPAAARPCRPAVYMSNSEVAACAVRNLTRGQAYRAKAA